MAAGLADGAMVAGLEVGPMVAGLADGVMVACGLNEGVLPSELHPSLEEALIAREVKLEFTIMGFERGNGDLNSLVELN